MCGVCLSGVLDKIVENMTTTSAKSIVNLPYEVLLTIVSRVQYTLQNSSAIYLTNRLLHDLMTTYHKSLIRNIDRYYFQSSPSSPLALHPRRFGWKIPGYINRSSTMSWPCVRGRCTAGHQVFSCLATKSIIEW